MNKTADIVRCPKCSTRNRVSGHSASLRPICGRCKQTLPDISRKHRLHGVILGVLLVIATASLAASALAQRIRIARFQEDHNAELDEIRGRHDGHVAQLVAQHVSRLGDTNLISGATAHGLHSEEWQRRRSYDAAFAHSPRELAILKMMEITGSSSITTDEVLRKVAELASPSGAEIEIKQTSEGYIIFVAFPMTSLTSGEHGARTKHRTKESLRREVEELTARVMKDIFIHCGTKDIAAVAVGCKHGVKMRHDLGSLRLSLAAGERSFDLDEIHSEMARRDGEVEDTVLLMCVITKPVAASIADWKDLPTYTVVQRWQIVHDEFPNITLSTETKSLPFPLQRRRHLR